MSTGKMVIVPEDELYEKIEQTLDKLLALQNIKRQPKYVPPKVAMEILDVRVSKLQSLRNNNEIRYAKTSNRGIMYLYESLIEYLDRQVVE